MNLPKLAIDRPVFMSCVVILIMVLGIMGYMSLGVDLFPDVSFPFVFVTVPYQGASPEEIETQISKPMEDELSSLQGVKKVSSSNQEGFAVIWVQFTLETDAKDAEQQVRDRVAFVRPKLPKGVDEPIIRRFDPTDQAVAILSLQAPGLSAAEIYDLADQYIKPRLAEVPGVGVVNIIGGHKREIQVQLDRAQLNRYRISAGQVADKIGLNGMNVPVGKVDLGPQELLFRSVGEYNDLERIKRTPVNFYGSDVSITVDKLGQVIDTVADADSYSFVNGKPTLVLQIFKQSKANTVAVVDGALKQMKIINEYLKAKPGSPELAVIQEMARPVRMNLTDVQYTIVQGILLTILVVLLFLGSFRSTLITITSLPVSLLGAFFLMNTQGYTLNVMTLLALSLAVGLLIDDAIVVRENIWRHIEEGMPPKEAAVKGAMEVALAVVATSSVIIAVFLPIAFLHGIVGQFFREFGMTVCFAMGISLFEAMVMGPLLSAYWARKSSKDDKELPVIGPILRAFSGFQDFLEARYSVLIDWCLHYPVEEVLLYAKSDKFSRPGYFLKIIFLNLMSRLSSFLKGVLDFPFHRSFFLFPFRVVLSIWRFFCRLFLLVGQIFADLFLFIRALVSKILFLKSERLIYEVKDEQKNGYSFAPLFYFIYEFILISIAPVRLWPLYGFSAIVFLVLSILNLQKGILSESRPFFFKGWVFVLSVVLFMCGFQPVIYKIPNVPVDLEIYQSLASVFFLFQLTFYFWRNRPYFFAHLFYDRRWWVLLSAAFLFFFSMLVLGPRIKFTFLPTADVGEFVVLLKSAPGTSLDEMTERTEKVGEVIQKHPEVVVLSGSIGGMDASGAEQGVNKARLYIRLKPYQQRNITTSEMMAMTRKELEPFKDSLQPQVAEASAFGDQAPFNLNLIGDDYATLVPFANEVAEKIRGVKDLADVQSTYDGGKPEFQAVLDPERMKALGVSGVDAGMELRTQVEGLVAAKLRQHGEDYDIRVRLKEDQRNLEQQYPSILVPNQNHNMVRLSDISQPVTTEGPARIDRQDRARYIMISGQLAPGGALGGAVDKAKEIMKGIQVPPGVSYEFVGQAQDLQDLMVSMLEAVGLAVLFTFMILASLYESPIIPFTIMLAIPLAIVGAFFALFIGQMIVPTLSLNIFSMVALIMLLGLVTKNSILLVDYTLQMMRKGHPRNEALKMAGKVRLRPILMTTFALIAGMLPVALALTEVGKFRQSMGVAIEGGLISSLLLTLVIVPSVFGYVDDFRLWLTKLFSALNATPVAVEIKKRKSR